jgi:hypothetical protein
MALVNLQTDLKSLKFGKDRPGGGSSNQPYIEKPLNLDLPPALDFLGNDFQGPSYERMEKLVS